MNNAVLGRKTMEIVRKHRYQTCNSWSKKELFTIRAKLSYNKSFPWKFISYRNEKETPQNSWIKSI